LKPPSTSKTIRAQFEFPRLRRRGPIEASISDTLLAGGWPFPRLRRRGPIEAGVVRKPPIPGRKFPRLRRRGPIEATRMWQIVALLFIVSTPEEAWPH